MNVFVVVFARGEEFIDTKIEELSEIGLPFVIVSGTESKHSEVKYRPARGKWDAVNFGYGLIPKATEVVILNDVDTRIHNLNHALTMIHAGYDFVYSAVRPIGGPQTSFYAFANPINRVLNIFAMGELIIIRRNVLDKLIPIPPCLSEDSYLLFKAMELGYKVKFCEESYVTTARTSSFVEEARYKERTTLGILQALDYSKPKPQVKLFYLALPVLAIMLSLFGKQGRAWSRGILLAIREHAAGTTRTSF